MVKHGSSHGLAVLVCSVASGLLVKLLQDQFPTLHSRVLVFTSELVVESGLPLEPSLLTTLLIAVALGVLWGIAFKYAFKK